MKPLRNFFKHIELSLQAFYCRERKILIDQSTGSIGLASFSLSLKNLPSRLSKRHPRHSDVHYAVWPFRCGNSRANVHAPVTRRYPAITRLSRSPLWTSRLIEKPKFLERWSLWPCVDPRIAAGYVTVNPFDVTTAVPYTLSLGRPITSRQPIAFQRLLYRNTPSYRVCSFEFALLPFSIRLRHFQFFL